MSDMSSHSTNTNNFIIIKREDFFSTNAAQILRAKDKTSLSLVKLSCTICSESTVTPFRLLHSLYTWFISVHFAFYFIVANNDVPVAERKKQTLTA